MNRRGFLKGMVLAVAGAAARVYAPATLTPAKVLPVEVSTVEAPSTLFFAPVGQSNMTFHGVPLCTSEHPCPDCSDYTQRVWRRVVESGVLTGDGRSAT